MSPEFLSETLEAEKDCNDGKGVSAKSKVAVVTEEHSPSFQKLTKEVSTLTTIVKSAMMGGGKPKTMEIRIKTI